MKKYNPNKIEKKWHTIWDKWSQKDAEQTQKNTKTQHKSVSSLRGSATLADKPKYYVLDMFPYPSGDGLHMGHTESYTASDIIYRYKRLQGFDVLHPQGFDSFGLPAENYAVKTGIHPKETTRKNTANYIRQMKMLGLGHDLDHLIYTSDPSYYKWTQWLFGKFFENGLVERKTDKINWCPSCNTGIANEQVDQGKCERCKTEIQQKEVLGWFFKITDFAEDLIKDLDKVDWPEATKKNQRNWIGKSEGAKIEFKIKNEKFKIKVFTTRPDTLFGATYLVVAPEHKLIKNSKLKIQNYKEVVEYIEKAKNKTELERMEAKEKTGVKLEGLVAINPANGEEIPIFVADYVLGDYGTGAIMAVPAHDERDFEFATHYNKSLNDTERTQKNAEKIKIRQVIVPNSNDYKITKKILLTLDEIKKTADKENIKFWVMGGLACAFYAKTIYRAHGDLDLIVKDKKEHQKFCNLLQKMGFRKIKEKRISDKLISTIYKNKDNVEIDIGTHLKNFGIMEKDFEENKKELDNIKSLVLSKRFIKKFKKFQLNNRREYKDKLDWEYLNGKIFTDSGVLINSGQFDGMNNEEAKKKITEFVGGEMTVNYRLRDWSISRQRYWGCPIPIVYSPEGKAKFVGKENLPWLLPEDVDFVPDGTAPLAKSKELKERVKKIFGKGWTPEVDTMDTFVDSSWYFLRYPDPENDQEFCAPDKLKKWLPVDLYIGGAEHTYMHLLYARFFVKAMHKMKLLEFDEPFMKLRHQGMVLDKNGVKMSKSKGNVINPNDMVEKFGADATRMYMMFAGPLEEDIVFKEEGVKGVYRFLEKVFSLFERAQTGAEFTQTNEDGKQIKVKIEFRDCENENCKDVPQNFLSLWHKTIKGVTEDIENLRFNTAISKLMIFINECTKHNVLPKSVMEGFLILLSPFAPHLAEELFTALQSQTIAELTRNDAEKNVNEKSLNNIDSIFNQSWPKYNPEIIQDKIVEMVIQINGKVRDKMQVPMDISEEEVKERALNSEKIKKYTEGKKIKKVIFVKGKLINLVV